MRSDFKRVAKNKAKNKKTIVGVAIAILVAIVIACVIIFSNLGSNKKLNGDEEEKSNTEQSISIMHTGDILIHTPILDGARKADGSYDFSYIFEHCKEYISQKDFAVGQFEGTISESNFMGYPLFKIPEVVLQSIKDVGFDMLNTVSNHSMDGGASGVDLTLNAINKYGMTASGTRLSESDKRYVVKNIRGIKVGFVAYSYETPMSGSSRTLNGIPMPSDVANRMNTFNYDELDDFYTRLKQDLSDMQKDGAEVKIVYMHWGKEYHLQQVQIQTDMAQQIANLGVDAIIGGHPHVIEPAEVLYGANSKKPVFCIYSLGNCISNQKMEYMGGVLGSRHTEDGVFLTTNIKRDKKNGAYIESVEFMPVWVNLDIIRGRFIHQVMLATSDGGGELSASYERTRALIEEGIKRYNKEASKYYK